MLLTGLPVVVVALFVNAWGIGSDDPALLAECSGLRFYDVTPSEHGELADLVLAKVREARASGQVLAPFVPAPEPGPEEGGYEDGVLIASWKAAREETLEAWLAYRAARAAKDAAEARLEDLTLRLRSRVGPGGSIVAGGWRVTVGKNGAIRVR